MRATKAPANAPPAATPVVPPTPTENPTPDATTDPPVGPFVRFRMLLIIGLTILVAIAAGFGLGRIGRSSDANQNRLVLYGNVDLRQVDLAFNNSERIAEVLVQEGMKVSRGQVLADWTQAGFNRRRRRPRRWWTHSRRSWTDFIAAVGRRKSPKPKPLSRRPRPTDSMQSSSGVD